MGHKFPQQFAQYVPGAPAGVYDAFVDKTIAFLAAEFNATFPRAQFLITVGNNDGYCGNYMSTPGSPFLAHMAAAWEPLVNRNGSAPNFVSRVFDRRLLHGKPAVAERDPRDRSEQRLLVRPLQEQLRHAAESGCGRIDLALADAGGEAERAVDDSYLRPGSMNTHR